MKTFKDLEFNPHPIGSGVCSEMNFDNGYGVSVIKFYGSYGFPDLWEIAILKEGSLTYDTVITNDVLGNQTDEDVTGVMKRVQSLT